MEKLDGGASEKIEVQKLISTYTKSYYLKDSYSSQDYFNYSFPISAC